MIKNIIFDYGSVLIRTDCRRVYTKVFGSWEKASWFRENILEEQWIRRLDIGDDYATCVADLQAKYPEYASEIAMYDTRFTDFVVGQMPGMNDLLKRLRAYGYHIFGLSNYSHKIYEIEKMLPIFRNLEGQVISSDVHLIKPDHRIFEFLLGKFSMKPEDCLFIDDRELNVTAARRLGIESILFPQVPFTREQIMNGIIDDAPVPDAIVGFKKELKRVIEMSEMQ